MKISKIAPALILFTMCNSDDLAHSAFDFIPTQALPEIRNHDLSLCRDPFVLKKAKKNISLISVLSDEDPNSTNDKKTAIVEYDDESVLVSIGDLIGSKWQVISIDDKEIVLESLRSKKRKTVLLNYE